jgi:DHA1 family bicyclomycin/chloramphenicol resistance-like MFS transporter
VAQAAGLTEEELVEIEPVPVERSRPAQPFIALGFALALVTCTIWAVDVTSPALPAIRDDFGLSAKSAGLIVSVFFIGRILGNFPAPRLLDALGSPNTASIGGLLLVAGACINIFAPTIEVLYVGRTLQGAGIALLVNAALRSILFAKPGRGAAMTLYGVASTFGSVLGLQSSGLLTGHYGWRTIFLLSASLGVVLTILPFISTRVRRPPAQAAGPDIAMRGAVVPVRSYLAPLAINFLVFCNYSIWVILPLYAEERFDSPPEVTANLLLVITIMHLAAALPFSRAIRRFGPATVLAVAVVIAVAGILGVLLAPSAWWLAPPLALYGIGMVGAVNSSGDIVLHRGGAGSNAVSSLRQTSDFGLVIGPIAAGSIADAFGYSAPFIVFPVLLIVAAVGVRFTARGAAEAV